MISTVCPAQITGPCGQGSTKQAFFQGEAQVIRLVSAFSLQQAWRGQPQILEMFVIPGEIAGYRLVVNEIPYTGPRATADICLGVIPDATGQPLPRFIPPMPSPNSFVLADKLATCRFSFLTPNPDPNLPPIWKETWTRPGWPLAVRLDMVPLEPDPSRLQPITLVAPIQIHRSPDIPYGDF